MRTYEILKQNGMYNDVLNIISDYSVGNKDYWKLQFKKVIQHINRQYDVLSCKYHQVSLLYSFELQKTLKEQKMTTKKKMLEYFELNNIHILYAAKQNKKELIKSYQANRMMEWLNLENEKVYPLTKQLIAYYRNV